jgi:hypothetical protein
MTVVMPDLTAIALARTGSGILGTVADVVGDMTSIKGDAFAGGAKQ